MSAHRACNDFRRTTEAERSRFLGADLTRRQVIGAGLGAGLAFYASRAIPLARALDAAEAQAAGAPQAPVLVNVFLPGGCDLLDTLVPLNQEGRYADLRGSTRVTNAPKLGTTGLGIHPSLTQGVNGGIKGIFDRGQIAFLPGIDYDNPDLSHFHSRHFWQSGIVTPKGATGWLGRYLDSYGGMDNPFQGVSISSAVSPLLRSAGAPVAAIAAFDQAGLSMAGLNDKDRARALQSWPDLVAVVDRKGAPAGPMAVARSARLMTVVADKLAQYPQSTAAPSTQDNLQSLLTGNGQGSQPSTQLAKDLKTLSTLLTLPFGIKLAAVSARGDFDTHSGQQLTLQNQLADVSQSLSQFQADLESAGIADRVLTLVWSEFGRRPQANRSAGTDHGAGGVAWVQGPRVRAGIASDYPDLFKFDDRDNLKVTIDFRRMYSSILEQWLGVDAAQVIPDAGAFGRVQLVA